MEKGSLDDNDYDPGGSSSNTAQPSSSWSANPNVRQNVNASAARDLREPAADVHEDVGEQAYSETVTAAAPNESELSGDRGGNDDGGSTNSDEDLYRHITREELQRGEDGKRRAEREMRARILREMLDELEAEEIGEGVDNAEGPTQGFDVAGELEDGRRMSRIPTEQDPGRVQERAPRRHHHHGHHERHKRGGLRIDEGEHEARKWKEGISGMQRKLKFKQRIRHFTWTWFCMTMATGGIANVINAGMCCPFPPYHPVISVVA
ncbi:hypothetical protein LTS18_007553 [Coniosporium uncinatum]|uniref:Uncharacterized protein n=1 Tax=Coniosporium uncinatum TaxID=93489 RepID=A0ACC3D2E8_9PEZI|nr:hypothetical protein LTS18_007553 [Coniosporium uncinatum]